MNGIAWDGDHNDQPSPSDVYVYLLTLENCDSPNTTCVQLGIRQARNGITCEDSNNCLDYPYCDSDGVIQLGKCTGCEWEGTVQLLR